MAVKEGFCEGFASFYLVEGAPIAVPHRPRINTRIRAQFGRGSYSPDIEQRVLGWHLTYNMPFLQSSPLHTKYYLW